MSENLLSNHQVQSPKVRRSWRRSFGYAIALPLWVGVSFFSAQLILVFFLEAASQLGASWVSGGGVVFNTVAVATVYVLTLLLTIGVPYLVRRRVTTRADLGLTRLVSWTDILLTPAACVIYFILSGLLVYGLTTVFPLIDIEQAQDVGFENLTNRSQYLLAFLTLVVVAPVAEEVLFRGYLFGKLLKHIPVWLAILITSGLFAAAHGQWNVAIDTFALSIILCLLRQMTGSIWAGVLLHMLKNGIAFYFLFINPTFLTTLGG